MFSGLGRSGMRLFCDSYFVQGQPAENSPVLRSLFALFSRVYPRSPVLPGWICADIQSDEGNQKILTIEIPHAILIQIRLRIGAMADQWREIEAEWQGASTFIGRNPSGGTVQMGKLNEKPGVSPMELILVGLAGCTGVDIVDILGKKRQNLQAFKVKVRGKKAEEYPKIFTEIEITYLLWGDAIEPQAVERAIHLSEEKYCSVSAMLRRASRIQFTYRILNPGEMAD